MDVLKVLGLKILDSKTNRIIDDSVLFYKIYEFIKGNCSLDDVIKQLDKTNFLIDLKEFRNAGGTAEDFYIARKNEIDSDDDKKFLFVNIFNIFSSRKLEELLIASSKYPKEFYSTELRQKILKEQENKCFLCGAELVNPHLHHIDYNKNNCDDENLVFLCPRCHAKTNTNRVFWKNALNEKKKKPIWKV